MSKKAIKAIEVESPVLSRFNGTADCGPFWGEGAINHWACVDAVRKLFRLARAKHIVFVAKITADESTYEVEVSRGGIFIMRPVERVLYEAFSSWLQDQIAAGRPHIGVRIVK